eukprot:scaffold3731_cov381-Prasinococcus_capsulatus_cf.AAC.1
MAISTAASGAPSGGAAKLPHPRESPAGFVCVCFPPALRLSSLPARREEGEPPGGWATAVPSSSSFQPLRHGAMVKMTMIMPLPLVSEAPRTGRPAGRMRAPPGVAPHPPG